MSEPDLLDDDLDAVDMALLDVLGPLRAVGVSLPEARRYLVERVTDLWDEACLDYDTIH